MRLSKFGMLDLSSGWSQSRLMSLDAIQSVRTKESTPTSTVGSEHWPDLGEVLLVVVDRLGVVDRDAGLILKSAIVVLGFWPSALDGRCTAASWRS